MNTYQNQYPRLYESLINAEAKFPGLLEKSYPRILQRVELLWGAKDAVSYLDSLILGDSSDHSGRSGRQGFPVEVLKEIVLLKQMHEFLFPTLDIDPYDPFSGYTLPAPTKHGIEPETASTISDMVPSATNSAARWPQVSSQRELITSAELGNSGENVYAQQGKPVEEILVHYGLMEERTLRVVQRMQDKAEHKGKTIGQILIEIGIVKREDISRALYVQAGVLMVDILHIIIPFETLRTVPSAQAREKQAIPVGIYQSTLFLAVADPLTFNDHQFFTTLTRLKINPVFAPRHEIVNRLNKYN
ncbi:MAG: hypothetical protein Q7S51_09945 [Gallionellaceae bacterium]|nr:hypothetical protein [Gallionellaceae bacterium]